MSNSVKVQSTEVLRRLYDAFEDLGMVHRYSEELGEFDINSGGNWMTFYVDPKVLKEEEEDRRWAEDADAVADYYWRQ